MPESQNNMPVGETLERPSRSYKKFGRQIFRLDIKICSKRFCNLALYVLQNI